MRKGGWCVSLTWAVGTSPMKNGTLNLDRQIGVGPPTEVGKVSLGRASQIKWKDLMRLGINTEFKKCSVEMGMGGRAS